MLPAGSFFVERKEVYSNYLQLILIMVLLVLFSKYACNLFKKHYCFFLMDYLRSQHENILKIVCSQNSLYTLKSRLILYRPNHLIIQDRHTS